MVDTPSLAIIGAGGMGRRHIDAIAAAAGAAHLRAVVDPTDAARAYAQALGVPWYPHIVALLADGRPDGVIIATPNHLHAAQGLECVAAGLPILVEKPIAADIVSAHQLVLAAERAGIPLLVGHHRRHNPIIAAARQALTSGAIGRIVAVHAMFWLFKPDDYFAAAWRHQPGAGPIFVNLIHDIDLVRHLCGEIVSVQALQASEAGRTPNEDTAVAILRFASGALGTVSMSDTIVAPWSWELSARENPAYPPTDQSCYLIGGTEGSLTLPDLRLWSYPPGAKGWTQDLISEGLPVHGEDPLVRQIEHFAAVIRGIELPLVPGREGLRTLQVIAAIKQSAETGDARSIVDLD